MSNSIGEIPIRRENGVCIIQAVRGLRSASSGHHFLLRRSSEYETHVERSIISHGRSHRRTHRRINSVIYNQRTTQRMDKHTVEEMGKEKLPPSPHQSKSHKQWMVDISWSLWIDLAISFNFCEAPSETSVKFVVASFQNVNNVSADKDGIGHQFCENANTDRLLVILTTIRNNN